MILSINPSPLATGTIGNGHGYPHWSCAAASEAWGRKDRLGWLMDTPSPLYRANS